MKYILAVDGGGSKTHAVCVDESGQVMGEGVSGPTSLTATTVGAASFNLKEAIRQATEKLPPETSFANLTIGLAGLDTPAEETQAKGVFAQVMSDRSIDSFVLVNDTVIALENGSSSVNALVVIAGTGSNCFGRNEHGETARSGGLDYILSDQGSGYNIGRAVLRKAVKSFDGRGPKTELEQFVCEHFHIATLAELKPKVHSPLLSKTEIAELAQLCLRAFDQGDQVAKSLFDHAIDELVLMAQAVVVKLKLDKVEADCVLAGSITKIGYVQTQFSAKLQVMFPKVQVVVPTTAPVYGAVKLGLKSLKT